MQIQKQTVDGIQVSFPSNLCEVNQACDLLQGFLDKRKNIPDLFLILLALREALTNAVIHGNGKNPELLVTAIVEIHDDQLVAVIRDQGGGFAWRSLTWELPNPKSESGRGLAIIRSCFENIEFNTSGNEITLRKQLESSGATDMLQTTRDGSKTLIRITENMVGSRIDDLRMQLQEIIKAGGIELVIDLQDVQIVDSLGMGLLVATHNSLKTKDGSLTLINVSPNIYNILTIMRLDKHFSIHKAV